MIAWVVTALAGVGVGPAPAGLDEALAPRRVALVVGLDDYGADPALPSLRYAAADARAMTQLLEEQGYEVTTLAGSADRDTFWATWSEATRSLQHHDLFVTYFAGHAELGPSPQGDRHPLELLFSDGSRTSIDDLGAAVRALPPLHRVVLLDTCYSARTQDWLERQRGIVEVDRPPVGRFDAWLFAAAPRQTAQEDPTLGHGVFTHFLLEALAGAGDVDGDGQVGVLEAYTWSGHRTAEHTRGAQVPSLRTERVGWADLPLTGTPTTPRFGILPWALATEVLLDGTPRGPGAVDPGVHTMEVRADGEVLARRRVRVREGEVLPTSRWVRRSAPFWALGLGAAGVVPLDRVPPSQARLVAVWGGRLGRLRPVVGAEMNGALGALGEARGPVVGGTVRGAVVGALGAVEVGPALGLGAVGRRPPAGWQLAPRGEPGVVAYGRWGAVVVGIDVGTWMLPVDGALAVHPTAGAWLGLRPR